MSKTKVVRGAGGRFQSVPDVDTDTDMPEAGEQGAVSKNVGPDGTPGPSGPSLVQQIIENCDRVRATSLELSNAFHYTGLITDNNLYLNLSYDERDDKDDDCEAAEYSAGHMVSIIDEIERDVNSDLLLATAGNILGYRVIPAMSLALFVFNNMTGNDRGLAFDHLLNARATDNPQRYENIVDLHNRVLSELDSVVATLFGYEDPAAPELEVKTHQAKNDASLIQMLRAANELLDNVGSICNDLTVRLNNELV